MPIKLLLADDSVVIQKLVGLSFANEDIEIITVDNGDDAVTRAIESKPDVVLADVVMPGKNGYEVCSEIRNNPELAATPILLLTGTFEAFDEGRASDAGATGHITKPFEAQALVDRVTEILSQRKSAAPQHAAEAAPSDFFEESASQEAAAAAPASDFAFGGPPAAKMPAAPMAEPSAETVALDAGVGMDDYLDSTGGDHTVAMMPETSDANDEDWMASPPSKEPWAAATAPKVPSPPARPTPNPEQTMLVDDFLDSAEPMPDPMMDEPLARSIPELESDAARAKRIGAVNLTNIPADDAMNPMADIPPADDLDLDGLSFGSQPAVPPVDLDGPSGDETVLADDLFSSASDLGSPLGNPLDDPMPEASPRSMPQTPGQPLSASQGLEIDFGGVAGADSIVPENANDYDVSSSDLDVDPMADDPSWGSGVPKGVQTGPAPITPPHDVAPPPKPPALEPSFDDTPSPGLEADWNAPPAAAQPNPAPTLDLGVTRGAREPEPAPMPTTGLDVETASEPKPDLSPDMRDRIHDTLEKVAWEAFSDLSDDIVRQLMTRVEQIAWEVIPQMAETLIKEEIRRMKADEGEE